MKRATVKSVIMKYHIMHIKFKPSYQKQVLWLSTFTIQGIWLGALVLNSYWGNNLSSDNSNSTEWAIQSTKFFIKSEDLKYKNVKRYEENKIKGGKYKMWDVFAKKKQKHNSI